MKRIALCLVVLASCGTLQRVGVTTKPATKARLTLDVVQTPATCGTGSRTTYDVGPGQPLASLGEVRWGALTAGDTVRIHWRAEPYREQLLISGQGTASAPIKVCGVPGPNGELPVLDGANAALYEPARYTSYDPEKDFGLVTIAPDEGKVYGYRPAYIEVAGLELRGAKQDNLHVTADRHWVAGSAGLYIFGSDHVVVRGNTIHDNGNGLFVISYTDRPTTELLVEGNYIYGNGVVGQDHKHNAYVQALGVTVQFNVFGPERDGAIGVNLKDRSAGTIIRYNRLTGGGRMIDMVDCQEQLELCLADPRYRETVVEGNLILNRPGDGANPIHFGGDTAGFEQNFRHGTLYFRNNTVVFTRQMAERYYISLFDLPPNDDEHVVASGNIVWNSGTSILRLGHGPGTVRFEGDNFVTPGWIAGEATIENPPSGNTSAPVDAVTYLPLQGLTIGALPWTVASAPAPTPAPEPAPTPTPAPTPEPIHTRMTCECVQHE